MTEEQEQQPVASQPEKDDVEKNKTMAIVGYILPFLFFIHLVSDAKNSPFARFHANQQLLLFLALFILSFVNMVISMAPIFIDIIASIFIYIFELLPESSSWLSKLPLVFLLILIALKAGLLFLVVSGIVNAYKGKMKRLPLIGRFDLIK